MARLLVTGAAGMLGHKVVDAARALGHDAVGADLPDCDLTDAEACSAFVSGVGPSAIVHCAAWTDVDGAEAREDAALRVNRDAAGNVAAAAAAVGARIVHVSTDYVFDGTGSAPLLESHPVAPLGAYGRTKLAGEEAVAAAAGDWVIARTAWLFGEGGPNFPDTMLRLAAERGAVDVVTDQIGSPTWTGHLAPVLVELAVGPEFAGVYHTTGAGQTSWHGFAAETFRRAGVDVVPGETDSTAFVRPAPRPAWSVLETERSPGPRLPAWEEGLTGHLEEIGRLA